MSLTTMSLFFLDVQSNWTNVPFVEFILNESEVATYNTINISSYLHHWSFLAYFTTWSNILFVFPLFFSSIFNFKVKQNIKLIIITYLFISSLIFWLFISSDMPWGEFAYFDFQNTYEHSIVLIFAIFWLIIDKEKEEIKFDWKLPLLFPTIYIAFAAFLNGLSKGKVAVYQFLNVTNWFNLKLDTGVSILLFSLTIFLIAILIIAIYWTFVKIFNFKCIKISEKSWVIN